eukprot:11901467-Alexandrium_andersonii.AAC.1
MVQRAVREYQVCMLSPVFKHFMLADRRCRFQRVPEMASCAYSARSAREAMRHFRQMLPYKPRCSPIVRD